MRAAGEVAISVEPAARRAARAVLTWAVRGRSAAGGTWGEAILAEFEETTGTWEALRWAASGVRVSWRERRGGRALLGSIGAALWHRGRRRRLLVVTLAVALLLTVVNQFAVTVAYVPTQAMEPALRVGDRLLVDKVAFRIAGVGRGDVVLTDRRAADPTSALRGTFVTRVLGLPGDAISCLDGGLWRNGGPVDEPYLAAGTVTDCQPITVPPGTVYLLGDSRVIAVDSRQWGPIDAAGIIGRVLGRAWPVTRVGSIS